MDPKDHIPWNGSNLEISLAEKVGKLVLDGENRPPTHHATDRPLNNDIRNIKYSASIERVDNGNSVSARICKFGESLRFAYSSSLSRSMELPATRPQ